MTFKEGDKVVRKKTERGYPWYKGNTILTVKRVNEGFKDIADTSFQVGKVWFYGLDGSWHLDKFELASRKFTDDEWE